MKMNLIAFAMLLGLIGGCSSPSYTPITDPSARIEVNGFSILPPQGAGWLRAPDVHLGSSDGVAFVKQATPGSYTHTVGVTVTPHVGFNPASVGFADYAKKPEVFAAYVKAAVEHANPPGGRMQLLELSTVPDTKFGYGARGHAKFEDHGSRITNQLLIQEDWTLTCLHPDSPVVMIEICFSERGLPGEQDSSLADVREQIFNSLQFRPLR